VLRPEPLVAGDLFGRRTTLFEMEGLVFNGRRDAKLAGEISVPLSN